MTVPITTSTAEWLETGSAGPYTFNFKFFANSDISVYRVVDGDEIPLDEGFDYSLSGAGSDSGGGITLLFPQDVGAKIRAKRNTDVRQLTSITNQGAFYPEIHEKVFDRLAMAIQDRERRIAELEARAFHFDVVALAGLSVTVVNADASAGPAQVDIDGLTHVAVIRDDASLNTLTVLDSSGATILRQASITLDGQDDYMLLVKIGNNWKQI